MSYTGNITVTNNYTMPLSPAIFHRSGLIGKETFISEQQVGRGASYLFDGAFRSVQAYPVADQFHITGRWNRGDDTYLRAETTIKYFWNKADDGGTLEIIFGTDGITFIPPSNPAGITQNYDHPISHQER